MRAQVSIKQTTRGSMPRLPFEKMAKQILGPRYELSLVVCGDSLAQRMNKIYRKKTYKPNVLSFPLSKTEGEIFLNVQCAKREAKKYGTTLQKRSHNHLCTKRLCRSPWNKGFLGISLTHTSSYGLEISAIS